MYWGWVCDKLGVGGLGVTANLTQRKNNFVCAMFIRAI